MLDLATVSIEGTGGRTAVDLDHSSGFFFLDQTDYHDDETDRNQNDAKAEDPAEEESNDYQDKPDYHGSSVHD